MGFLSAVTVSIAIGVVFAIPMVRMFCRQIDRHLDQSFPADLRWF